MALIFEIQDEKIQVISAKSKREERFVVDGVFDIAFDPQEKESTDFIKNIKTLMKEHKITD